MIEAYDFGLIKIDGQTFVKDVFINLSGEVKDWQRQQSHLFQKTDVENLLEEDLEVVVFGTGKSGFAKLTDELQSFIQDKGIELIIFPTDQAVQEYNEMKHEDKKVVAFLHLTC